MSWPLILLYIIKNEHGVTLLWFQEDGMVSYTRFSITSFLILYISLGIKSAEHHALLKYHKNIGLSFIIARTWKQPRCPSADEWIRKLWYIYTMEHYSAIKNNSFESVLMRWMKLKTIIQIEVSQKVKHQ